MAVVNREQVGWLASCPLCEQRATVHQTKIGRGGKKPALYWRGCGCGYVAPFGAAAQDYIRRNMTPMEAGPPGVEKVQETESAAVGETGAQTVADTGKTGKKGFLSVLLSE